MTRSFLALCLLVGVAAAAGSAPAVREDVDLAAWQPQLVEEASSARVSGFNWGSGCAGGSGKFADKIPHKDRKVVGYIPAGLYNPVVNLSSSTDIDIQLEDVAGKTLLVHWPKGLLNSHKEQCTTYRGMKICYSGYNGVKVNGKYELGHEWIKVIGYTNTKLKIWAYGYTAGDCKVEYAWSAPPICCSPAKGDFTTDVKVKAIVPLGTIPVGILGLRIEMQSPSDIDIVLMDKVSNKKIIGWPDGLIKCHKYCCHQYKGLKYCYSGYNGDVVNGKQNPGKEHITIHGRTNVELTISVYGYASGSAKVKYIAAPDAGCKAYVSLDVDESTAYSAHTNKFTVSAAALPRAVTRRGAHLYLRIPFWANAAALRSEISLTLGGKQVGPKTASSGHTDLYWTAHAFGGSGEAKDGYDIHIPVNFAIGNHEVTATRGGQVTKVASVAVLFNPWHKAAAEYMSDAEDLKEFVSRTDGRVWFGDVLQGLSGAGSMAWNYHQFELLDPVLKLIDDFKGASPVDTVESVVRLLTWALNAAATSGDGKTHGVLWGRWDGKYTDGVAPGTWTNSKAIFDKWIQTGYKPVKYGQCWVYASIQTSALRTLGIPGRTVTNFRSAHDSQPYDFIIDTSKGESIWNFHVWNEAWFKKTGDAKPAWHAADATPQELSEGKYQMGPALIDDVKHNRTEKKFDTAFVYGEVSAKVKSDTGFDTTDVGRYISTLKRGCTGEEHTCRLDVSARYKPSPKFFAFLETEAQEEAGSSDFTVTASAGNPPMTGNEMVFTLHFKGNKALADNVTVSMVVESVHEDGTPGSLPNQCGCCKPKRTKKCACLAHKPCSCMPPAKPAACPGACSGYTALSCQTPARSSLCCCGKYRVKGGQARGRYLASLSPVASTILTSPKGSSPGTTVLRSLLERGAAAGAPKANAGKPAAIANQNDVEHGRPTPGAQIATFQQNAWIAGEKGSEWTLKVPVSMYAEHLWRTSTFRVTAVVTSLSTPKKEHFRGQSQVSLLGPDMGAKLSCATPHAGELFTVNVTYTNPLPIPLTNVKYFLDVSSGDNNDQLLKDSGVIDPHASITVTSLPMRVEKAGSYVLALSLDSCQIRNSYGSLRFEISSKPFRVNETQVCDDRAIAAKKAAQAAVAATRVKLPANNVLQPAQPPPPMTK